ncbi:hypothetical protein D9M69_678730 [compost metagenome]
MRSRKSMESRRTSSCLALAFLRGLAGAGRLAMLTSLCGSGRHRQGLTAFGGHAGLQTNGAEGPGQNSLAKGCAAALTGARAAVPSSEQAQPRVGFSPRRPPLVG